MKKSNDITIIIFQIYYTNFFYFFKIFLKKYLLGDFPLYFEYNMWVLNNKQ